MLDFSESLKNNAVQIILDPVSVIGLLIVY